MASIRSAGASLLLALCALTAGCASFHKPLSAEDSSRIKAARVTVVVPQETFQFTAIGTQLTAALGGGLIPALIDASVQKSRQAEMRAQVQPVLDKLLDVDFREEALVALKRPDLTLPFALAGTEVVSIMPGKSDHDAQLASLPPEQALMRLTMQYSIDPESRVLTTRTYANVWQPGQNEKSYAGSLVYQGLCESLEPDSVRTQMRDAMAQTLRLAALDIAHPADQGQRARGKHDFRGTHPVKLEGEVLASDQGRVAMRTSDGAVFWLLK